MANGQFGGGDGSKGNPYIIEDELDFMEIGINIYTGYFKVANDINMVEKHIPMSIIELISIDFNNHTITRNINDPIIPQAEGIGGKALLDISNINIIMQYKQIGYTSRGFGSLIGVGNRVDINLLNCKSSITTEDIASSNSNTFGGLIGAINQQDQVVCNIDLKYCEVYINNTETTTADGADYGLVGTAFRTFNKEDVTYLSIYRCYNGFKTSLNGTGNIGLCGEGFKHVIVEETAILLNGKFGYNTFIKCNKAINSYVIHLNIENMNNSAILADEIINCYACIYSDFNNSAKPFYYTTIQNSYWNNTLGINAPEESQFNGRTDTMMKMKNTFVDWDFTNIWGIDPAINGGYPYLRWYAYGRLALKVQGSKGIIEIPTYEEGSLSGDKLKFSIGSTNREIKLIETSDANALPIRIMTPSGIKAVSK